VAAYHLHGETAVASDDTLRGFGALDEAARLDVQIVLEVLLVLLSPCHPHPGGREARAERHL
jgi:hypothetical protein